jgi:hypothetical protein
MPYERTPRGSPSDGSCVVIQRVAEANVNVHVARMRNSRYANMLRENALTAGPKSMSFGHFGLWYPQL